ncbi:ketopantoate reductase family protein [Nocardia sp. 348MFTsu5.1]|uniref:ketopantoate reductase family protein n=1 Tax=Nocardia sp. 348MFTsu5.1 TaxID=1172185 RepID=UPI00055D4232|nr:2-dehydropantoate 2-reductase N-terminal domain-containing protein [Nocardia sp. 348MFTsu5.1]
MPRYVIVGAGAVGASFAAALSERTEVLVIARGAALDHLRDHPLKFHASIGSRDVHLPVAAIDEVSLRTDDVLVLAVKTQHVGDVATALAWLPVHSDSGEVVGSAGELLPIVTTQNGLDAERVLARWFTHIVASTVLISARYTTLGEVRVGGRPHLGSLLLGEPYRSTEAGATAATTFAADLRASNFVVSEVEDITAIKATKILHSVKNGLEVLAGDPDTREKVGEAIKNETRAVLAAAGITPAESGALFIAPDQTHLDAELGVVAGQQSTWQSFARGAGSHEVDHLNGEIVLLARLHGVEAPLNRRLQVLLGAASARGGGIELDGLDSLVELTVAGVSP